MARDPLHGVVDAPLFIVPRVMEGLRAYRPGLEGLAAAEFERLRRRLLEGIEGHPTRFWVLKQVQKSRDVVEGKDISARKQFNAALEALLAIVGAS